MMNEQLYYRMYYQGDLQAVYQLLITHGWQHRIKDIAFLEQLIANSQLVYVVEYEREIIGFARVLTDFLSNAYLSMFVIKATAQRQGIGSHLLQHLMTTVPDVSWVLRAGREGANAFFESQGFSYSEIAMEKLRL